MCSRIEKGPRVRGAQAGDFQVALLESAAGAVLRARAARFSVGRHVSGSAIVYFHANACDCGSALPEASQLKQLATVSYFPLISLTALLLFAKERASGFGCK